MKELAEILESQLSAAFEVKDQRALHNYTSLLVTNILERDEINRRFTEVTQELKTLSETMRLGFEHVNKRFEDMNKRFEDMNNRFEDMNKRFEDMNNRFEDMNKRFEDTNKRITVLIWVFSIWMTLFTALAAFMRFFSL